MEVVISTVEPSLTAVVIEDFDASTYGQRIIPMYDEVYAFLRSADVMQNGQNIALYNHGRTVEVGVQVDRAFEPIGAVVPSTLPAGRAAHATHTGPLADLRSTQGAIERFCDARGEVLDGRSWEIYGDPDERGQFAVEIYYLLS